VQLGVLVSLGLIAAILHSALKLRLGIPGHSAVLWLTPLLVGRFLSPLAGAASVASTSAAVSLYALGGLSFRWPLALSFGTFWLVGPVLDLYVLFAQRLTHVAGSKALGLVSVALAGVVGNFAHLALKAGFGAIGVHAPGLGLPRGAFEGVTYFAFGLAAGLSAWGLLRLHARRTDLSRHAPPTGG